MPDRPKICPGRPLGASQRRRHPQTRPAAPRRAEAAPAPAPVKCAKCGIPYGHRVPIPGTLGLQVCPACRRHIDDIVKAVNRAALKARQNAKNLPPAL